MVKREGPHDIPDIRILDGRDGHEPTEGAVGQEQPLRSPEIALEHADQVLPDLIARLLLVCVNYPSFAGLLAAKRN